RRMALDVDTIQVLLCSLIAADLEAAVQVQQLHGRQAMLDALLDREAADARLGIDGEIEQVRQSVAEPLIERVSQLVYIECIQVVWIVEDRTLLLARSAIAHARQTRQLLEGVQTSHGHAGGAPPG